eukprot:4006604-Amphidinium_carterae.2
MQYSLFGMDCHPVTNTRNYPLGWAATHSQETKSQHGPRGYKIVFLQGIAVVVVVAKEGVLVNTGLAPFGVHNFRYTDSFVVGFASEY